MTGIGTSPPTADEVRAALSAIVDPEIGLPITDLGLVYEVEVSEEGNVEVTYTLTSLGCPAGPVIDGGIKDAVAALAGVRALKTTIVFRPAWSPERMSEEAKAALGIL